MINRGAVEQMLEQRHERKCSERRLLKKRVLCFVSVQIQICLGMLPLRLLTLFISTVDLFSVFLFVLILILSETLRVLKEKQLIIDTWYY